MTTVAEQESTVLPAVRPRRSGARRIPVVAIVVAATVVAAGALLGDQIAALNNQRTAARSSLLTSQAREASARDSLAATRAATASAKTARAATLATDVTRAAEAATARADLSRLRHGLALASTELEHTQNAEVQVAQYSAPRDGCVRGVETATAALQNGNPSAAIAALRAAADDCSIVLAAVSGAVYPYDFPDPDVVHAGGTFYAYSTNSGAGNIQLLRSSDLQHWKILGDALAALPAWATPGATWAPSVFARPSGYVAYYTVREAASGRQCVSVASASGPAGPFVDASTAPLVCGPTGSIDPSPYVDEKGSPWLQWVGLATADTPETLWSQPLSADGLLLKGAASPLLTPGQHWEGGVVEAPSMYRIDGHVFLFYSGNSWTTASYAEGVAACDGPAGPCHRMRAGPLLASTTRLAGPGGGAAFSRGDGTVWLAFHAYTTPAVGYPNSRTLHLARVRVVNGVPSIAPLP